MDELPLVRWLPSRRRKTARPRLIIALGGVGLGVLALAAHDRSAPLMVYNASASAPLGFYRVTEHGPITRGNLVLARTPEQVRQLAAARGYLPQSVPLIKRVAAVGGDAVCVKDHTVLINARPVARQLWADRMGRPLPAWTGCRTLTSDEVFLLMESVPASFDGRYFGPVSRGSILGKLAPLWPR